MAGKEFFPKRVVKKVVHIVDAPIVEKTAGIGLLSYSVIVSPFIPAALIVAGALLLTRGINRTGGRI